MGRKDLLRQSVKGSPIVPNSDELREHLKWSSEPPYVSSCLLCFPSQRSPWPCFRGKVETRCANSIKDGFPSSPNDYKTGARRPQIGGAYLSDVDEYRPKIPVDDKKRVGPTKLDAVPSRMSSSQASTIAIHTFPTDTLKKTKSRIAQKKAASRGSLSPGSKASHVSAAALVFDIQKS
jgi:hypothetical protein